MKSDKITVGRIVNIERLKKCIDKFESQQKLSEITGIDRSLINKHYCKKQEVTFDSLIRYADTFNVSVDFLLGREKEEISEDEFKQKVCEYTGLNEDSVTVLHQLSNTKNDILTFINRSLNSLLQSNKKDRSAQHTETVKGK